MEGETEREKEEKDPNLDKGQRRENDAFQITMEEVNEAIKKLKIGKATGEDGIKNEAWLNADKETREELRKVIQDIRNGEDVPDGWKEGWICPIFKKGDKDKAENYGGITLMDTG